MSWLSSLHFCLISGKRISFALLLNAPASAAAAAVAAVNVSHSLHYTILLLLCICVVFFYCSTHGPVHGAPFTTHIYLSEWMNGYWPRAVHLHLLFHFFSFFFSSRLCALKPAKTKNNKNERIRRKWCCCVVLFFEPKHNIASKVYSRSIFAHKANELKHLNYISLPLSVSLGEWSNRKRIE